MQKCIFFTKAYNAEGTLSRTIESVLAQTHDNWLYYCVNNGSRDRTGTIIREYAKKDHRIFPLTNKKNHVPEPGNTWPDIAKQCKDEDLMCFLDADDEYKPDFLEKMLAFMAENTLDIAACANDYIDAQSKRITRIRQINTMLLLEGKDFDEHFILYLPFMRTVWGKLYKISVLRKFDLTHQYPGVYGGDFFFAVENFRNANRVGILADSLHKYYRSKQSVSHKWDATRLEFARLFEDVARTFLIDKCGSVSPQNDRFLKRAYLAVILSSLRVLFRADLRLREKLRHVRDIFTSDKTKELFRRGYIWRDILRFAYEELFLLKASGTMR